MGYELGLAVGAGLRGAKLQVQGPGLLGETEVEVSAKINGVGLTSG